MRPIVTCARRGHHLLLVMIACALAVVVAACGGSGSSGTDTSSGAASGQAAALLMKTFKNDGAINSGTMSMKLVLTPVGSSLIKNPITLAFGGPFQSEGKGKIPDSDFTISGSAEGHAVALRLISAGGHGYVAVDGNDYELPQTEYTRIESGFTSLSGTSGNSGGKSELGKLGIDPSTFMTNEQLGGTETVDGTPTTRINADVSVSALTDAFSKILANASRLGLESDGKLPSKLTPTELAEVSSFLGSPKLSVWSATSDHSLRKLQLSDTIPVNGAISSALGGLSKLGVSLSFSYGAINQRQTITAPAASQLKPYSEFQTEVKDVMTELEYVAIESASGAGGTSTATGNAGSKYNACVTEADGNVTKLEKCAGLLGG